MSCKIKECDNPAVYCEEHKNFLRARLTSPQNIDEQRAILARLKRIESILAFRSPLGWISARWEDFQEWRYWRKHRE